MRPAAYVAGYILKPSTNVIQLDNTLRLTLWNSFYYKRCLYQTILKLLLLLLLTLLNAEKYNEYMICIIDTINN